MIDYSRIKDYWDQGKYGKLTNVIITEILSFIVMGH